MRAVAVPVSTGLSSWSTVVTARSTRCWPSSSRMAVTSTVPVRVAPGKTWEKEGKRSGKLVFGETITEYRDQDGELVITARGVGVRTERVIES